MTGNNKPAVINKIKRLNTFFAVLLGFTACTSTIDKSADSTDTSDTKILNHTGASDPVAKTLCFQKLSGTANQDTTSLRLFLEGVQVTGDLGYYPAEKDKRVGKIIASKNGEHIKGIWIYMQEGVNDTVPVEFKLAGDKLVQKNYTVDPKTGREIFSEGSLFKIVFRRINCIN